MKNRTVQMLENSVSKQMHFVRRNSANCLKGIFQLNLFLTSKLHEQTGWVTEEIQLPGICVEVCTQAPNLCFWNTDEFWGSVNSKYLFTVSTHNNCQLIQ